MKRRKQTRALGWPPGWAPVWGVQMTKLHQQGANISSLLLYVACCIRYNNAPGAGLDPCGPGPWTLPDAALGMGWISRNTIQPAREYLIKAGLLTRKCNGRKPDGRYKESTYTFTPVPKVVLRPCTTSGGSVLCSNNKKKHSHQDNSPKGIILMAKDVSSAGGSTSHDDPEKQTAAEQPKFMSEAEYRARVQAALKIEQAWEAYGE